jgi:hypothetical protein
MQNILVKEEKYSGKYVALKNFIDQTVIVDGKTPREVLDRAISKGYMNPVILFVPIKDMVQIY